MAKFAYVVALPLTGVLVGVLIVRAPFGLAASIAVFVPLVFSVLLAVIQHGQSQALGNSAERDRRLEAMSDYGRIIESDPTAD